MINFSTAKVLSYNHQNDFLGEIFRFASKKELNIEGTLYAPQNFSGVEPIWTGILGMENSANDYDEIILGGVSFGYGRVNSLNFREGNDVTKKDYTASITIFDTGNMFNASGSYYNGLSFNDPNCPIHLAESFSENFDFSIKDDQTYSYSQNISLKFISGAATGSNNNPIDMAKSFASQLLNSTPAFGLIDAQHSGFYNKSVGRRFYTESYDAISNECTFSERMELAPDEGDYSFTYSHELSLEENGNVTVSEQGRIKGLTSDYYADAEAGYSTELQSAFSRCSSVFAAHISTASNYPLVNSHISLNKKINKFTGEISYTVTFSNNPAFNTSYNWEYTQEISRDRDTCSYTVKENGNIVGLSQCTNVGGYGAAQLAFTTIKAGIASRAGTFYSATTNASNPLKLISSSQRINPSSFAIEYENIYSDDLYRGVNGFKKVEYTVEDKLPVHLVNKFNIINVKEMIQSARISHESVRSVNLRLVGERSTTLASYTAQAKVLLNKLIPPGEDTFISSCSYNFTPKENTFNISVSWTYFGDRQLTNVLI